MNDVTAPAPADTAPALPAATPTTVTTLTPAQIDAQPWYSSLPEDIRAEPSIAKYTDKDGKKFEVPETFLRGYVAAQRLLGTKEVAIPTTEQQFKDLYRKLGQPDAPDNYAYVPAKIEGNPEFGGLDNDFINKMRSAAHKIGMNQTQFNEWTNFFEQEALAATGDAEESVVVDQQVAMQELSAIWKQDTDKNIEVARRAQTELAQPGLAKFLNDTGLGDHPEMVQLFYKMGNVLLEPTKLVGSGQNDSTDAVKAEIASLMANPAYTSKNHPEHKILVDKVTQLYSKLG